MAQDTLDIQAAALNQLKEKSAILDRAIAEKTEVEKSLDERIAQKEANEKSLTEKVTALHNDLASKSKALKNQQDAVNKAVDKKNQENEDKIQELKKLQEEVREAQEELTAAGDSFEKEKADLSRREDELKKRIDTQESREVDIKEDIKIKKNLLKQIKTEREAVDKSLAEAQKIRAEVQEKSEKLKQVEEDAVAASRENMETYQKIEAENRKKNGILNSIEYTEKRIMAAAQMMRQEYERIVAKEGAGFNFEEVLKDPNTIKDVAMTLLWWLPTDILKEDTVVPYGMYAALHEQYISQWETIELLAEKIEKSEKSKVSKNTEVNNTESLEPETEEIEDKDISSEK